MYQTERTFAEWFCDRMKVPTAQFERAAFRELLHRQWRPLAGVLWRFFPRFFGTDRTLVRRLAQVQSPSGYRQVLDDYVTEYETHPFLRFRMRLRVSSHRLRRLAKAFFLDEGGHKARESRSARVRAR